MLEVWHSIFIGKQKTEIYMALHRTARGELVDLDVLKIKQQLASTPPPVNVTARREFIDEKAGVTKKQEVPELTGALAALDGPLVVAVDEEETVEVVEAPIETKKK
jgi:hypothetical protein